MNNCVLIQHAVANTSFRLFAARPWSAHERVKTSATAACRTLPIAFCSCILTGSASCKHTCTQVDAWLFSDEIYRLLEQQPDEQRLPSAVSCLPRKGITLGGLSKAFGLQGLRAGWLVCKDTTLLQQVRVWT